MSAEASEDLRQPEGGEEEEEGGGEGGERGDRRTHAGRELEHQVTRTGYSYEQSSSGLRVN